MGNEGTMQEGETGVLQHLRRTALNGLIAEITGGLKIRLLYNLYDPADSERCLAYKVRVPGHPKVDPRIEWCVKPHQIRRIDEGDVTETVTEENTCLL